MEKRREVLPMDNILSSGEDKKKKIMELTSQFLHWHYCENNAVFILPYLDSEISWFGAAEHEYLTGVEKVTSFLNSLEGHVPKCNIKDEVYDVIQPVPDLFICSGMAWISTSPSSLIYLRMHQRITAVFRWSEDGPRCCHLHVSNPYAEMSDEDVGFPQKMSMESRRYFQEQIEAQKKQIEEQHEFIRQMYFEDVATGLYNRNKFNEVCEALSGRDCGRLGIAYFDLNGLKKTNDLMGHQAGDRLLSRTAAHLLRAFGKRVYRTGGDEFIVIDRDSDEETFNAHVRSALKDMEKDDISIAAGTSWRSSHGDLDAQINEADKNMYAEKRRFYERSGNDRRRHNWG